MDESDEDFSSTTNSSSIVSKRREDLTRGSESTNSASTKNMSPPVATKPTSTLSVSASGNGEFGTTSKSIFNSTGITNGELKTDSNSDRPTKPAGSSSPPTGIRFPKGVSGGGAAGVREMHGYVGFANIPNQVFRKAIKQGFDFTLMVVGQSGLGKSTFINSLFLTEIYGAAGSPKNSAETVKVEEQTVRLVENGVNLSLTLVDTPGFGDQVDNSKCWEPIIQFVDKKYSEFFTEETKIQRLERIPDHRVHCCLYFIAPTGHGLKMLDVEFMKQLHERVNIIPVIAKADTMTSEELNRFKERIMKEIKEQNIKIYQFPDPEDEDESKEVIALRERVPFAVVGSNLIQDVGGGKKVRCRKYPWGIVEVENMQHNDFVALRNTVIRTHMIDLIEVTRSVHYENFRCRQLLNGPLRPTQGKVVADRDPFTMMEGEKKEHEDKMKRNQEEMEKVFQEKVREKQQKFKQQELDLEQKVAQLQTSLEAKRQELQAKQKQLSDFKEQYPQLVAATLNNDGGDKSKKSKGLFKS